MPPCSCDNLNAGTLAVAKVQFWESLINKHEEKLNQMRVRKHQLCTRIKELQLQFPSFIFNSQSRYSNKACNTDEQMGVTLVQRCPCYKIMEAPPYQVQRTSDATSTGEIDFTPCDCSKKSSKCVCTVREQVNRATETDDIYTAEPNLREACMCTEDYLARKVSSSPKPSLCKCSTRSDSHTKESKKSSIGDRLIDVNSSMRTEDYLARKVSSSPKSSLCKCSTRSDSPTKESKKSSIYDRSIDVNSSICKCSSKTVSSQSSDKRRKESHKSSHSTASSDKRSRKHSHSTRSHSHKSGVSCSCRESDRSSFKSFLSKGAKTPPELYATQEEDKALCSCSTSKTSSPSCSCSPNRSDVVTTESECTCTGLASVYMYTFPPPKYLGLSQSQTGYPRVRSPTGISTCSYPSSPVPKIKTDYVCTGTGSHKTSIRRSSSTSTSSKCRKNDSVTFSFCSEISEVSRRPSSYRDLMNKLMPYQGQENETLEVKYKMFPSKTFVEDSNDCEQIDAVMYTDACQNTLPITVCTCSCCPSETCADIAKRSKDCICFPLHGKAQITCSSASGVSEIPRQMVDNSCSPCGPLNSTKICQTKRSALRSLPPRKSKRGKRKGSYAQTESLCSVCSCTLREAVNKNLTDYGTVEEGSIHDFELPTKLRSKKIKTNRHSGDVEPYSLCDTLPVITPETPPDRNPQNYTSPPTKIESTSLFCLRNRAQSRHHCEVCCTQPEYQFQHKNMVRRAQWGYEREFVDTTDPAIASSIFMPDNFVKRVKRCRLNL